MRLAAIFGAIAISAVLESAALAQTAPRQAAPAPVSVRCSELRDLNRPLSPEELEAAQLCSEIAKLNQEVRNIQAVNAATSGQFGFLIPFTGIIAAIVSGLVAFAVPVGGAIVGAFISGSQRKRLEQEKTLQEQEQKTRIAIRRETHNLALIKGLGGQSVQLASVSSLMRRVEDLRREYGADARATSEYKTIADVVVSMLKDPEINPAVSKYVADEMIGVFGVRKVSDAPGERLPLLKDFNLQRTRLSEAYWANVVGDDVDFFEADLTNASLRNASMVGAVFYKTDLRGATLTGARLMRANLYGADLRGARLGGVDFTDAVNLADAQLDASTRWDERTVWPAGFTPRIDTA